MPASGAHLRLEHVSVAYPSATALESVSLEIEPGEAVALVGASGAGKTTLLDTLNGMTRPTMGRVEVDGSDLTRLSPAELRRVRAGIGFVHQDLSLIPNIRVVQNVACGRLGRRTLLSGARDLLFPSRAVVAQIHAILERVGIAEKLYERTDRLSGGQRQRVAIARALFQEPRVLLADEPVSSVDPARARSTVALLKEISAERGLTLCVSMHNLDLARKFFPRLVALREGRVIFDKTVAAVTQYEFDELYRLTEPRLELAKMSLGSARRERGLVDSTGARIG